MESLSGDPTFEEEFRSLKKRDLIETYLFKKACCSSGPQKCKNSDIRRKIMDKLNTSPISRAQPTHISVLSDQKAADRTCSVFTQYPGNKPVDHPEWISDRKAFRQALDGIGNLSRWLHNKPFLTDLEVSVMEREGRANKISPPETSLHISLDAANSPHMLKLEIEEIRRCLGMPEFSTSKLAKLLDWHGTGTLKRADLCLLFEKEGFFTPNERLDALTFYLKSPNGKSIAVKDLATAIHAWSRKHQEKEEEISYIDSHSASGSRHNRQADGITLEKREAQKKENMQDAEVIAIMRRVLASTKISHPSSLGGLMGRKVDHVKQLCLRECMKSVELCHQYGLHVSPSTLKRAMLHPGDMGSSSYLRGKSNFPGSNGGLASLSTPKTISLEAVPHKGYKKVNRQSIHWADPNAFWPGREDHVRLFLPVTTRPPSMVLFQPINRSSAPSPGNWPINHSGYSTSGNIEGRKIYIL